MVADRFLGMAKSKSADKSWALLSHIKSFMDGPWLCIRDFNTILQSSEKLNKRPPQMSQIDSLCTALEVCQLEDLRFKGYPYTRNNSKPGNANTQIHLERAVATKDWRANFQLSSMTHLSTHASDHLPIVLQTQNFGKTRSQGRKGFKF